jgi:hypothetical protein
MTPGEESYALVSVRGRQILRITIQTWNEEVAAYIFGNPCG